MRPPRGRRPASRSRRSGLGLGLVGLVCALVMGGCASMPDSGSVNDAGLQNGSNQLDPSDIDPAPPTSGESPANLAQGFLDAMTASPIRLDVAREYLASASSWNPQAATITYRDSSIRLARGGGVVVRLFGAHRLDASGAWRGAVGPDRSRLRLTFSIDSGGDYRIVDPPNALVVPETWFAQRFRQADLYFFDPTGRILVPQPVFVPRGDQFATTLIDDLLAGPGPGLTQVVRSYLPHQGKVRLSVPVDEGVADVSLTGAAGRPETGAAPRALAQLAWTLRQDPGIQAVRLSLDGTDVPLPQGEDSYSVEQASRFDPTGYLATPQLYGLAAGRVTASSGLPGTGFGATQGPLGTRSHRLRWVAANLPGDRVAAVTRGGASVLVSPTATASQAGRVDDGDTAPVPAPAGRTRIVVQGAVDLARPAWDFAGRLWLVERNGGSAEVSYIQHGTRHPVDVPGITGARVSSFLVSRDGSRLVAAVHGEETDTVRVARIRVSSEGRVLGATASRSVGGTAFSPLRIRALAFESPTTVAVLSPLVSGRLSEVSTVSIDGSPTGLEGVTTTVRGRAVGLAGSPVTGRPVYAVTTQGLVDLADGSTLPFAGGQVRSVGYAG